MKEYPLIMSAFSVKAIQAGNKTQTRRLVTLPPDHEFDGYGTAGQVFCSTPVTPTGSRVVHSKFVPGDRLWVREQIYWAPEHDNAYYTADRQGVGNDVYAALIKAKLFAKQYHLSPIFMPRFACRIVLEVTALRVERVQDITEEDALAEGITMNDVLKEEVPSARDVYRYKWDELNWKRGPWAKNPHVFVVTFRNVSRQS